MTVACRCGVMYPSLFEISHDMLCVATVDGVFVAVNASWSRTLGWSFDELTSKPFLDFVHPDDRERTRTELGQIAAGKLTAAFRNRYRGKDGDYRWIDWRGSLDPATGHIYAAGRDTHDLMLLNEGLKERDEQLTRLMAEQLDVRELELRRISNALHDSAVQNSAAALMFLDVALREDLSDIAREHVERAREQIRGSLSATRKVVQGLDPCEILLHDVGAAIEDLAEDIARQFAMQVDIQVGLSEQPGERVAAMVFRVAREGLVNAGKHAPGAQVRVTAYDDDAGIHVEVTDAGPGVPDSCSLLGLGLGLPVLRERIRRIGGTLALSSSDAGTQLAAFIPTHVPHAA